MIKVSRLISLLMICLSVSACTDKDFYIAKLYNDSISIKMPIGWHVIEEANYRYVVENLVYDKFIGQKDGREGLQLEVRNEGHFGDFTLKRIIDNQIVVEKANNTETNITSHSVHVINGDSVGVIKYTFGIGDTKVFFGETMLIVKGKQLFIMRIFSTNETVEEFQKKCTKITASVKIIG